MSSVFSDYVRTLSREDSPPSAESFEEILSTLRGALVHGLKKRALWSAPPRYLGIYGGSHWDAGDSLDELLLACYQFIFVRRLPGLINQLKTRSNIDGLIFLNIQHFLHDAQRRHDPLGFRVFEVTRAAVEQLLSDRVLYVVAGERKLRNDTILGFAPWGEAQLAEGLDFKTRIDGWCDLLMPELAMAWSKDVVVPQLIDLLAQLASDGVEAFRLGDVLSPLKQEVRRRWGALLLSSQGEAVAGGEGHEELAAVVRMVSPTPSPTDRRSFHELVSCVADGLGSLRATRKTQSYLRKLFQCLRQWAAELEEPSEVPELPDEKPPSDKRLGELLDIPRGRIKELRSTLGGLVEACQGASGVHPEARAGAIHREQLAQQTAQAAARARLMQQRATDASKSLESGDILLFDAGEHLSVEWLVIEVDPADGRWLILPLDDHPLVGSQDVTLDTRRVRCAQELWLDEDRLETQRTGRLDAPALERVRDKQREIQTDDVQAPLSAWEVDEDSEYRSWMQRLASVQARLNTARPPGPAPVVPLRRPGSRWHWSNALAAAFAAVAIGLSFMVQRLNQQVEQLSAPFTLRSSSTFDLRFGDVDRSDGLRVQVTESHVLIFLVLTQIEEFPTYRLELWEGGRDRQVGPSQEIASDREILLVLPRAYLKDGHYRLRIYGLNRQGEERLLDEQPVRIEIASLQ